MEFVRGIANLRPRHRGCVVTIGNYDGVHRGHQAVLANMLLKARRLNCPAVVVVFEPTAQEYFTGSAAPARLTTLREKLKLLQACAVDRVLCIGFDHRVATMEPDEFINKLLVSGLAARQVIIGDDFRFGRDRSGDFQTLFDAGAANDFAVTATPVFLHDGIRVSSSAVRAALAGGDLVGAKALLGRDYTMAGRVIRGEQLGRQLGYPTANIAPRRRVLPLQGIFAVQVRGIDDQVLPAIASLGTRPMVDGREPLLEVHLFDFDADLYGRYLEVAFIARLREERLFADLPAMVEQMHRDTAEAREILGLAGG